MNDGARSAWLRLVYTLGAALVVVGGAVVFAQVTRPAPAVIASPPPASLAVAVARPESEPPAPLVEALETDTGVEAVPDEAPAPEAATATASREVAARVRAQTQKSMQKRLAKQKKREMASRAAMSERLAGGWSFRPKSAQGVAATVQGALLTLVAGEKAVGACGPAVPVVEQASLRAAWRALELSTTKPARLSARWLDATGALVKAKGTAMGSLAGPAAWTEARLSPPLVDGATAIQLCVDVPPGSGVVQVRDVVVLGSPEAPSAEPEAELEPGGAAALPADPPAPEAPAPPADP